MNGVRKEYAALMTDFLEGTISPSEFERRYLDKFKAEQRPLDEWTYRILDEVFGHVDAFCGDEELYEQLVAERPGWPLNTAQLREKVREAVTRLTA